MWRFLYVVYASIVLMVATVVIYSDGSRSGLSNSGSGYRGGGYSGGSGHK